MKTKCISPIESQNGTLEQPWQDLSFQRCAPPAGGSGIIRCGIDSFTACEDPFSPSYPNAPVTPKPLALPDSDQGLSDADFAERRAIPRPHKFNIQLNFDFDRTGFFAKNPKHAKALKEAAAEWSSVIADDFRNKKAGTRMRAYDPMTVTALPAYNLKENVDDLMVFVGAGSAPYGNKRYVACATNLGNGSGKDNDFEPDYGLLAVNSDYFSRTQHTDTRRKEIYMHELGHVLGIGTSKAWSSQCRQDGSGTWYFHGANAMKANNGRPIKLHTDKAHLSADYVDFMNMHGKTSSQISPIVRGILRDLGYKIK